VTSTAEFISHCRRKLVDTSMKNRLLNYRGGARSSSVDLEGEHPAALWDLLVAKKKALEFVGVEEPEPGVEAARASEPAVDAGAGSAVPPPEPPAPPEPVPAGAEKDAFAAGIAAAAVERHTDTYLQTRLVPEVLSTKLRRLADTARLTREEQGVDTLYRIDLGVLDPDIPSRFVCGIECAGVTLLGDAQDRGGGVR
jgi:hypothetical protein